MRSGDHLSLAIRAARQIERTAHLHTGWNFGRGVPSTEAARAGAALAASLLAVVGVDALSVFPDTDGGVMVTGYRNNRSIEILTYANGAGDVMFEDDGVDSDIVDVSNFDELKKTLGVHGWQESNTSASYLRRIMTFGSSGIIASHSKTLATAGAFPSLTWNARSHLLEAFVVTSPASTHLDFPVRPQLSGASMRQKSNPPLGLSKATPILEITAITT